MRSVDDLLREARSTLDRYSAPRTWQALADGALVVDIRSHAQRLAGEIPGALVLERNVLEWRLDPQSASRIDETGYDREVVIVCAEGYQSSLAAASLQQLGLQWATDLVDGFDAWLAAGLPTVPGASSSGSWSPVLERA